VQYCTSGYRKERFLDIKMDWLDCKSLEEAYHKGFANGMKVGSRIAVVSFVITVVLFFFLQKAFGCNIALFN